MTMTTIPVPENLEHIWTFISSRDQTLLPKWLREHREVAWSKLKASGFPTTRNEEWKYTSVRGVLAEAMLAPCPVAGNSRLPEHLEAWLEHRGPIMVFVDGIWSAEYSRLGKALQSKGSHCKAGHGIEVLDFATALAQYGDEVRDLMKQMEVEKSKLPQPVAHLGAEAAAFQYLADAMMREGAYVRISKNATPGVSILLLHLESGTSRTISSPRTLIRADEQVAAMVTEVWLGPLAGQVPGEPSQPSLAIPVTDIHLAPGAHITHTQIHAESPGSNQIGSTHVALSRDSRYSSFVFTAGGKLCRKNLTAMINGEGAEVILDGLYTASAGQHMDHHTTVDHRVPHATSNQLYKGVLLDKARAVFNGKVFVRRDAQQTAAFQSNKNLLLGRDSEVDTKPQLEIDANDVKCSHGATVARLNPDEVFYLQSRGIDRKDSESMLCYAFANEVLERIPDEVLRQKTAGLLTDFFQRESPPA